MRNVLGGMSNVMWYNKRQVSDVTLAVGGWENSEF